ncbi:hypothetical protein ACIGXM_35410 [Kitasatospora sp. NPDC052896]|uniref:hypothetical protein n=1 Tax=Kitasatospora sp. NPDC052896 TaxID=3364061 RepID=UPI0037CC7C77
MKVRFKGVEGVERRVRQGSATLREGIDYSVLEIFCQSDGVNFFRIECRDGDIPGLFDSRIFELREAGFQSSWTFTLEADGSMTIGPASWAEPGFWEDYMDGKVQAYEAYRYERDRIMGS